MCNDDNSFSPEECEEGRYLNICWMEDVKNRQNTKYSSKNNSGTILEVHIEDIRLFIYDL